VAQSYQYDPFGVQMAATGSVNQPMRFSTKPYDENTGLYFYGYRFYNPGIGRWMTRDPIGERGGINLYGFAGNNPVNWADPYGLEIFFPLLQDPPIMFRHWARFPQQRPIPPQNCPKPGGPPPPLQSRPNPPFPPEGEGPLDLPGWDKLKNYEPPSGPAGPWDYPPWDLPLLKGGII